MEIKMEQVSKSFGQNKVLEGVDFKLTAGEIHALMGENGAGKSTLMNILTGLHKRDAGKIMVDGVETITTKRQLISFNCWVKAHSIFKISGFTLLTQRITINRW